MVAVTASFRQAAITSLQVNAVGVRNDGAECSFSNNLVITKFASSAVLASAKGAVGVTAATFNFSPTSVTSAEATPKADRHPTAETLAFETTLEVTTVPEAAADGIRNPDVDIDLPELGVSSLEISAGVFDQPKTVVVPLSDTIPGEDQLFAEIKQGRSGIKARGSGDQGIAIRNPVTGDVWFTTNDIVWSQVDIFIVSGGSDTSKTYSWLDGWEVLVTQAFTGQPPSDRKMLQMNTSYNYSTKTLRVWGGSERTLIMVLAR